MKKQNVINLIKYHVAHDDAAFRSEVCEIAKDFDNNGDSDISFYLLSLIRETSVLKAQSLDFSSFEFLRKDNKKAASIHFPDSIADDILSIARSINRNNGIHRFLFVGKPGTGKTEACRHLARLTHRTLLVVRCEDIVNSYLGQTSKNIVTLFNEINKTMFEDVIVLFDELDSLVMDRINDRDMREMGRATSTFLRQLDELDDNAIIIGTTNLFEALDKALVRRFESIVSFDRYSVDDICDLAELFGNDAVNGSENCKPNARLLRKIVKMSANLPNPGELKNLIRTAVAFSDQSEYGYLRRLMNSLNPDVDLSDIAGLRHLGFTLREIEILSSVSKSSAARMIAEGGD